MEDHSGVVWLGVDLALLRFQNGRFRELGGQRFASLEGVSGIAEDSGGTVWLLTPRGQLFNIIGDTITKQASLNDDLGRQKYLVADPNGGLWLGAPKGTISYFRDGHLQSTRLSSPRGPVDIRAPFVDSDNSLLVPSSQGLYRLNHGQVTLFSSDNGLPCPETFNVIRDNHGALWIYTRCGLVRIAGSEWAKWIESPHVAVSVMILDALDGAQAGTGGSYQPNSSKAPNGRLWFQTGVSIQVLDPDRLYENAILPPVYVEGVVADHKRFDATSLVKVPALNRDLEIDYTAPSFSVPQKVRFRYMLEGRDREWQDAGTRRQAFYTDLRPGHYRFRVTASNSRGVWNQTGASLEFVVLPALYQTLWFRSICVIIFLAMLVGLYQLRVRQLARQYGMRERLLQLEADLAHVNRVSMLGEMAASLAHEIKQPIGAAITSANSCIEWLAHEPPNLDRARAAAGRIDKYGNRAAEIIDRIRSFYRKSPPQRELVDVNRIIQEILTLLGSEAARTSVAVRTELEADLPEIMADRVQLQQVFMNLVLNAIEAMKDSGGELMVKSQIQDSQVLFSVSDTGVGLPMEKVDQIFSAFFTTKPQGSGMGLAISRSIVESHGGQLWATSNGGRGATFQFSLPTEASESTALAV